jgi:outer membrane protein, heavy metal efflux system
VYCGPIDSEERFRRAAARNVKDDAVSLLILARCARAFLLILVASVALVAVGGCQSTESPQNSLPMASAQQAVAPPQGLLISPVAYVEPAPSAPPARLDCDDLFAGEKELNAKALVAEVLRRNPTLEAMAAAWQAAVARYPQAVSLEDPMLSLAMGPGTFGDPNHDVAWMIEGSQKIPWHGKREARGQEAQAEAAAARAELDAAALKLVESTKLALADYYLAARGLALNSEALSIMGSFREDADARYRANMVTQLDILQADLELNELRRRRFELERMNRVAIARINTLLHRPPDAHLPAAPSHLPEATAVAPLDVTQSLAMARRPDLRAAGAQVQTEQAKVELAELDYNPDLDIVARYDAFWQKADRNLAPMVGVNLNVPLDNARRRAAIREAQWRLDQRRAEYQAKVDEIRGDLTADYQQLDESRRAVELLSQKAVPIAEDNLTSARGNYTAGKLDFLRLLESERQTIMLQEKKEQATADSYRALATYEHAAGGLLPQSPAAEVIPPGRQ